MKQKQYVLYRFVHVWYLQLLYTFEKCITSCAEVLYSEQGSVQVVSAGLDSYFLSGLTSLTPTKTKCTVRNASKQLNLTSWQAYDYHHLKCLNLLFFHLRGEFLEL